MLVKCAVLVGGNAALSAGVGIVPAEVLRLRLSVADRILLHLRGRQSRRARVGNRTLAGVFLCAGCCTKGGQYSGGE